MTLYISGSVVRVVTCLVPQKIISRISSRSGKNVVSTSTGFIPLRLCKLQNFLHYPNGEFFTLNFHKYD